MIPERPRTTLGRLRLFDLETHPAWEATRRYENTDEVIEALTLTLVGAVPREVGEVWCLSRCTLADGAVLPACALYRGDQPDGPDLWSIWFSGRWLSCKLPPAPAAVVARRGPSQLAASLGISAEEALPLAISSVPSFETAPHQRSAVFRISGRA